MKQTRDVVVIGAALGGVTAIAKIASEWPSNLPAAVLIALATPKQPAPMVQQIIRGYAPMNVDYAVSGERIRRGRIYLSPPGRPLLVGHGGTAELDGNNGLSPAMPSSDRLFASAAAAFGNRVIGIVLSGNSRDGTLGLSAIESAGGVGIVQEPEDAAEPLDAAHCIATRPSALLPKSLGHRRTGTKAYAGRFLSAVALEASKSLGLDDLARLSTAL